MKRERHDLAKQTFSWVLAPAIEHLLAFLETVCSEFGAIPRRHDNAGGIVECKKTSFLP